MSHFDSQGEYKTKEGKMNDEDLEVLKIETEATLQGFLSCIYKLDHKEIERIWILLEAASLHIKAYEIQYRELFLGEEKENGE